MGETDMMQVLKHDQTQPQTG